MKTIVVAVVGNPNSGKSTLINAMCGTNLKVGNWPGVTVEKKTAILRLNNLIVHLVDLPGIYSLNPCTQEEEIARDFLVKEKPDLIINVVDSTNFERNLYLTIQLLELGIPVIMALNVYDEAKKKELEFNIDKLENWLGIRVIPTVATKKDGIKEVIGAINEMGLNSTSPKKLTYRDDVEKAVKIVEDALKVANYPIFQKYPVRWVTLKLLEGDKFVMKTMGLKGDEPFLKDAKSIFNKFEGHDEIHSMFAEIRYKIANKIAKEILRNRGRQGRDLTERIDRVVLNRFLALPVFLVSMWFVFKLAFDFSTPISDWIEFVISGFILKWATYILELLHSPNWLISLTTDGVIQGVGAVIVFIPPISVMMFMITLLEGSGYLARVAFVMDKLMHSIGLHGKSFIPMLLGFGCNVPSIYATRILETERDKKLTAFLVPLMSCGARLPVYVIFINTFFQSHGATVLWSLYMLGIFMAIVLGFVLKKTLYKGSVPFFVMELPPYRVPVLRDLVFQTWQKLKHFVVKAGTYILAMSVIMWFLLNTPYGIEKHNSILGKTGRTLSPVFEPLGFGTWEASASLVAGLIAKEVIISTMVQIYGLDGPVEKRNGNSKLSQDLVEVGVSFVIALKDAFLNLISLFKVKALSTEEDEKENPLMGRLRDAFTPLSAYSFLVFVLFYWPCVIVGIAMKNEFGSFKIYGQLMLVHSLVAWLMAVLVYQGGKILGF
ncbi:MAG: ferrous iron transport protein B [Deltaproteobacteria bacterium]|nr:ferrous iron transport protein B [Deltaproteobacteria bacterium]